MRRRIRVITDARLWWRKTPEGGEFEPAIRLPMTGELGKSSSNRISLSKRRLGQRKEMDRLRLSYAAPEIQLASNRHCTYGYKAMGNLYLSKMMHVSSKIIMIVQKA